MAIENKMFMLDTVNVKSTSTTHNLTTDEVAKYTGFAVEIATTVSFNGGGQDFPIQAGFPMGVPGNTVSIELGATSRLYLGY